MLKTALKMTEKSKKILLLFDIDGTLINSKYSGNQQKRPSGLYLVKAAAQVFLGDASKYNELDLSNVIMPGGTDGSIMLEVLYQNKIIQEEDRVEPREESLRSKVDYACNIITPKLLRDDIKAGNFMAKKCPNVDMILEDLAKDQRFELGLLTGNYAVCAKLKLEAAGVDITKFMYDPKKANYDQESDKFTLNYDVDPRNLTDVSFRGSFGSDNFVRRKLPPVACQRYEEEIIQENPDNNSNNIKALIIGDTPKDVDCAAFNGLKSVGVCTGRYNVDDLKNCGGDIVLEDLSNIDEFKNQVLKLYGQL